MESPKGHQIAKQLKWGGYCIYYLVYCEKCQHYLYNELKDGIIIYRYHVECDFHTCFGHVGPRRTVSGLLSKMGVDKITGEPIWKFSNTARRNILNSLKDNMHLLNAK